MESFRDYLKAQCEDPDFRKKYSEQCCICQRTALIICAIQKRGISNEYAAREAGVELERLKLLESADRCSPDDVSKLYRFLGLTDYGDCRRGPE